MKIKLLRPTDVDYPIIMKLVPFADKYDLIEIDDLIVVPLLQVFDAISEVKADIDVRNGVECCPTCGKPIKDTFTKADMVAMLTEIQLEVHELWDYNADYIEGIHDSEMVIQQKINALKGEDQE